MRALIPLAAAALTLSAVAGAPLAPDGVAPIIESFLGWAIEGHELRAEPAHPAAALPHRSCDGRFDPEHPPAVIYVAWQLAGEGQQAVCNWKYVIATHRAVPLTPPEAAEVAGWIAKGTLGPQERAFLHATPQKDGRIKVAAGYCWGSAIGTFAVRPEGAVLIGDLAVHGY
jgi:hypothetical protein